MKFRETNIKRAIKNLFMPKKKNVMVLEPHLGLGDGIICLGLVRELSRRYPSHQLYYACLHRCFHTLVWMFQDLNNVYPVAVTSGREARQLAGFLNAQYMPIGIHHVDIKRFDAFFYEQHQVNFDLRWEHGDVPPGPKTKELFEQLNPDHQPYILICNRESGHERYTLNFANPHNKLVIEVQALTNNIFDWVELIQRSDEIHTIDTAFIHVLESTLYKKEHPPLYFHRTRKSPTEFTRRLPWHEVIYSL
jgi:ADP-heptose:LPS heptosyltransferase